MLPFLKNKHEGAMAGPVEHQERKPDDGSSYEMMDAIVDDLMDAMHSKNKKLLKSALEALVEHIQEEDQEQDELIKES